MNSFWSNSKSVSVHIEKDFQISYSKKILGFFCKYKFIYARTAYYVCKMLIISTVVHNFVGHILVGRSLDFDRNHLVVRILGWH